MPTKKSNVITQREQVRSAWLALAEAQLATFPASADKRPLIKDWQRRATTEVAKITAWLDRWPDAIPALQTGERNGIAVLDLDVRDDGRDGITAIEDLGLDLSRAFRVRTPSGGLHLYFGHRGGLSNSAGHLSQGVDVTRQTVLQQVRRFDGAAGGRRGGGMGTFGTINTEVAAAGPQLRSRARYLAMNNPWLSQGVANWVGALIGPGIMPTGAKDSVAAFTEWAPTADADGLTDFWGLQASVARALVVDGESFVQIIDGGARPVLRIIPAELVDESMTRTTDGGGYIVNGVEFDSVGQRVAYHVFPAKPTDLFQTYAPPIRIAAESMMHVFRPLAAGQVRGVSWLAPVILGASEFDQLCDALLVGTKVAAMFAGFLVNQNDASGADPFDDMPSLEPGTLQRLPGGWDVRFTTPQQVQQASAFIRLNLQMLAAGLGLPEHLVSGDLSNANYSSLRAGLLPFRQRAEQTQYHVLVPQMLNPIWREVIGWAAVTGGLPDFDADARAALAVEWLPPRPMQVDPLKDTEATILEMSNGLTSRRKAVAERGWNVADLDAEIAADTFTPRPAAAPKKDNPDA